MSDTEVPPEPKAQPNIQAILKLVRQGGDLDEAERSQASAMQSSGQVYKRIERDFQGHRGAVAAIRKLVKMPADKRADYMRTFEPLCVELGYFLEDQEGDLFGNTQSAKDDTAEHEEGDEVEADPAASNVSALEAARDRLKGGQKAGTLKPAFNKPH